MSFRKTTIDNNLSWKFIMSGLVVLSIIFYLFIITLEKNQHTRHKSRIVNLK